MCSVSVWGRWVSELLISRIPSSSVPEWTEPLCSKLDLVTQNTELAKCRLQCQAAKIQSEQEKEAESTSTVLLLCHDCVTLVLTESSMQGLLVMSHCIFIKHDFVTKWLTQKQMHLSLNNIKGETLFIAILVLYFWPSFLFSYDEIVLTQSLVWQESPAARLQTSNS